MSFLYRRIKYIVFVIDIVGFLHTHKKKKSIHSHLISISVMKIRYQPTPFPGWILVLWQFNYWFRGEYITQTKLIIGMSWILLNCWGKRNFLFLWESILAHGKPFLLWGNPNWGWSQQPEQGKATVISEKQSWRAHQSSPKAYWNGLFNFLSQ